MPINSIQQTAPVNPNSSTTNSKQPTEKPAQVPNQNQQDTVNISNAAKHASGTDKGTSDAEKSGHSGT